MSYLKEIPPDQAEGKRAELYQQIEQKIGYLPNAFKMLAVSETVARNQLDFIDWSQSHPSLSPKFSAILRLLVSREKECNYCIDANTAILQNYFSVTPAQLEALKQNPGDAPLDEREKALLVFVLDAVENSLGVTSADIEALRELGWSDAEILEALYQGAYQVTIDILFNAFNVQGN